MTYEKIKPDRSTPDWGLPIEVLVQQIERVTNGEVTPYSDAPFSHEPPGIIAAIIHRFLCDETIARSLESRLKFCNRRMEYIVHPCWHEGYDTCTSLKNRRQLELTTLIQTGNIEATYRYHADKAHWYWFLAGWLSACRAI